MDGDEAGLLTDSSHGESRAAAANATPLAQGATARSCVKKKKAQPRLNNNRYEGLVCTDAYPAADPEGTQSTRIR